MRLIVYCKNCHKNTSIGMNASDRVELKMKYGRELEIACKKCNTKRKYNVNDIKAEQGLSGLIVFLVIILLMVIALKYLWKYNWNMVGSVYLIPVAFLLLATIYGFYTKEVKKQIRNFNES